MGLMAILAGLLSNTLVSTLNMGPVAPFDAAAIALLIGGVAITLLWNENYGDLKHQHSLGQQFQLAWAAIMSGEGPVRACSLGGGLRQVWCVNTAAPAGWGSHHVR